MNEGINRSESQRILEFFVYIIIFLLLLGLSPDRMLSHVSHGHFLLVIRSEVSAFGSIGRPKHCITFSSCLLIMLHVVSRFIIQRSNYILLLLILIRLQVASS